MSVSTSRETGHSGDMSNTGTSEGQPAPLFSRSQTMFDTTVYDDFYEADNMAPNPKRVRSNEEAPPALPRKSALRASRLLDNLGLKLGGSLETAVTPGQATPLDLYLSSEEDASSDADDFSDYGYDSSNEDPTSPTRRSHEDTARVVSVVYAGKPSIVDLSVLRRRSASPNSIGTRTRSSMASSRSPIDRPDTPASSTTSSPVQPARKSSLLSDLLVKKRPTFLHIDPYANGSTYSLELPKSDKHQDDESPVKPPKTPTQILRGVSRTFSLVKKRSRPLLSGVSQPQQQAGQSPRNSLALSGPAPNSTVAGSRPVTAAPEPRIETEAEQTDGVVVVEPPRTPMTPVTYGDIIKAAKKNAMMMPPSPTTATGPGSPVFPSYSVQQQGSKRGILSGLAARRRSVKLTGKAIG